MFSINTNIASLQAQENLRVTSDFQSKTISRVTSGLRIVNSGDDAAGLAIANGYRSDINVLTQGVRNANDGISQLQIIDGGMNNISQLLDRARTLATQSASGTFTGDRSVLNDEFKSVVAEIDRQSQAIGLNTGGTLAKNLAVFIGGGKGVSASAIQTNGSVSVDLSKATVDANSLGLTGVQAQGTADLSGKNSSTTVSAILGDATNQASLAQAGYTDFYVTGPGFNGTGSSTAIRVSVNTNGIASAADLVTAINSAITQAASGSTQQATAFKNANIKATITANSTTGAQTLSFTSSTTAFQVRGGDRVANALMGDITSGSAGDSDFSQAAFAGVFGGSTTTGVNVVLNGATTGLTIAGSTNLATLATNVNSALSGAGLSDLYAIVDGTNVNVFSRSGQSFALTVTAAGNLGAATTTNSAVVADSWYNSKGDYTVDGGSSTPFQFTGVTGTHQQTISITATDAQGAMHSKTIQLTNSNAATIDAALKTINDALLSSNDTTLQNIVAIKDAHGSVTSGVRFSSTLTAFNVSLGKEVTSNEGIGTAGQQGAVYAAAQDGTAATADISTQQGALDAVNALANAVSSLGKAQAVVGKGQNNFTYAVNLAQSQLSNLAAAESRIRDADLAAEAANLTKAQTAIQAGVAALAQANSAPQAVLTLLRG